MTPLSSYPEVVRVFHVRRKRNAKNPLNKGQKNFIFSLNGVARLKTTFKECCWFVVKKRTCLVKGFGIKIEL